VVGADVPARIAALMDERKKLERDLWMTRKRSSRWAAAVPTAPTTAFARSANVKLLARAVEGIEIQGSEEPSR
jgi:alanyl-tRNA synthetase